MPLFPFRRRPTPTSEAALTQQQQIQEQLNPTFFSSSPTQEDWYWGRMASGDEEDLWWRRLSDNWFQKDVIPSTYLELHNLCYEAYNANPLAFAIIEITTSFVLGKGVMLAASQPEVQQVLMDFWNDPDNHMETRVYSLCTELALYGEQFIRFFVNPYSGRVKIRQIDPSIIDEIETDPDDRLTSHFSSPTIQFADSLSPGDAKEFTMERFFTRQCPYRYSIPAKRVDGMDVCTVAECIVDAVAHARAGNGPTFVDADAYRFLGHYQGDTGSGYRSAEEIASWRTRDPILLLQKRVKVLSDDVTARLASEEVGITSMLDQYEQKNP